MEALLSSKTLVLKAPHGVTSQEMGILHSHHHANLNLTKINDDLDFGRKARGKETTRKTEM
jgi:hypothetical protein